MLRVEINRTAEGLLPSGKGLLRQAVDEVEVQVFEACFPRPADCVQHIEGIVDSFQLAQFIGMKRLDPETDPIEPDPTQTLE